MSASIGAIILAAGGSSRLGEPKQFLQYRGMSFIRRAAEAAIGADSAPVVVVAGRDKERVVEELATLSAEVVHNADWELGVGSSVRTGIAAILRMAPELKAVVLMVCDQPFVSSQSISKLIALRNEKGGEIVASSYDGILGVPALFDRAFFKELAELPHDTGARHLFKLHPAAVVHCAFPEGEWDVDTKDDYARLISKPPGRVR